jgi:hypothetical protein
VIARAAGRSGPMPPRLARAGRRAPTAVRRLALLVALPLAFTAAGCAGDSPDGGRFRLASSLADDLLPGAPSGADRCNEFHRSLRGRTPERQRAELERAYGVQVDAQRAARHVAALEQFCAGSPAGA